MLISVTSLTLKSYLDKALALAEESKTLHLNHLQKNEYTPARRKQIYQEAASGEKRWQKHSNQAPSVKQKSRTDQAADESPVMLHPGQRQAQRDPVGATLYANS